MRVSNFFKKAVIGVLVFTSVCTFTACKDAEKNHVCDYTTWYLAKAPTCTKNGIIEGICECGEKTFEEIQATGHSLVGGVCSVCGESGTSGGNSGTENKVNPGQVVGLTLQGVYDKFATFGYNISYQQFLNNVFGGVSCALREVKMDSLGIMHCVFKDNEKENDSANVIIPITRVDYKLENVTQLKNVNCICLNDGIAWCILADGTELLIGLVTDFEDFDEEAEGVKIIRSIFINQDNVLGVVYTDDTVKAIAKIADVDTAINGSQLYYRQIDGKNGYETMCIVNLHEEKVEIPLTHLGLPVTRVAYDAFAGVNEIVEITLCENIKEIAYNAFKDCSQLTTIKLNDGLEMIGNAAFYNCPKLQRVIIPSTVKTCESNAFYGTNCSIYVDLESKPAGWSDSWNGNNNKVYWKGEWELVNGVPVPLQ